MSHQEYDVDRCRCAWTNGGERCHYPGAVSHGTRGEGPWYCGSHILCGDPVVGAQIIEQSRGWVDGTPVQRAWRPSTPRPHSFTYAMPEKVRLPYVDRDDVTTLVQAEPGANG